MFYYYGGKRQLARVYPRPAFGVVVEPFAGSASYSMANLAHIDRVILVEKDPRVVGLWRRLLAMSPDDLRSFEIPEVGSRTSEFLYMTAAASNAIARCRYMTVTPRMVKVLPSMLERMARLLPRVQEKVELIEGDYTDAPDIDATWFIDPPYQVNGRASAKTAFPQGMGYAKGCDSAALDFGSLGSWCSDRRGQVIVCEQRGATWLPFAPLAKLHDSSGRESSEVVWEVGDLSLFGR